MFFRSKPNEQLNQEIEALRRELALLKERDIENKRFTTSYRNISRALRTIEACNKLLVEAKVENKLLNDFCQIIVEKGGYYMAWVGMAQNDPYQSVIPVAQAGYEAGYLEKLNITWADTERGRGPTGRAIRTKTPVIARNLQTDPLIAPWRNEIIERGYASAIAIPLIHSGAAFGSVQMYAKEPDAFDDQEADLLLRLSENLAYGIIALREHEERKKAVTELRQSEELFRTLVENASDAIFITDPKGNLIDANLATCQMFKAMREELLRSSIKEFVLKEDLPEVEKGIEAVLAGNAIVRERRFVRTDGTSVLTEISAKMIARHRIHVFVRDITARKKIDEALVKETKFESIGLFAGGIAHDFNNLLTAILGNLSLSLSSMEKSNPLFEQLTEAEGAAVRAQDLARQLMTFSKGSAPLRKEVSIASLVRDSANFAARGSSLKCQFNLPDNLWIVMGDEGQLSQVIHNTIFNSIQASQSEGIRELLSRNYQTDGQGEVFLKPGTYVEISIKDHGVGIPEEHFQKIFDPYFTNKPGGTGLGLATAYSIVKKHGGEIKVSSAVNEGATFNIYLPAVQKSMPAKPDLPVSLGGKGKILLMDDEELVLNVTSRMLNKLGYSVVLARNGDEAVAKFNEALSSGSVFDALILDLTIPGGMGGRETLQKILAIRPDVKAIASSGYSNDVVMADWSKFQFCGLLPKPYRLTELGITLRQVIASGS